MVPNTNFNYPIALGAGEVMKPGKYKLDLMAYADKNPKEQFATTEFQYKGRRYVYVYVAFYKDV